MNDISDGREREFELSQYVDGQLPPRRARELEKRLETDAALRDELARYASLNEHLAAMDDQDVPGVDYDAQRGEIMARLARKLLLEGPPRRRLWPRPVVGTLAAAAALLIVAGAALLIFRKPPTAAQPTVEVAVLRAAPLLAPGVPRAVEITILFETPPAERGVQRAVECRPLEMALTELPLAPPLEPGQGPQTPPGTVLVSFGRAERPPEHSLPEMIGL